MSESIATVVIPPIQDGKSYIHPEYRGETPVMGCLVFTDAGPTTVVAAVILRRGTEIPNTPPDGSVFARLDRALSEIQQNRLFWRFDLQETDRRLILSRDDENHLVVYVKTSEDWWKQTAKLAFVDFAHKLNKPLSDAVVIPKNGLVEVQGEKTATKYIGGMSFAITWDANPPTNPAVWKTVPFDPAVQDYTSQVGGANPVKGGNNWLWAQGRPNSANPIWLAASNSPIRFST